MIIYDNLTEIIHSCTHLKKDYELGELPFFQASVEVTGSTAWWLTYPTPLKKIRAGQLGWWHFWLFLEQHSKSCSSHHQPVYICFPVEIDDILQPLVSSPYHREFTQDPTRDFEPRCQGKDRRIEDHPWSETRDLNSGTLKISLPSKKSLVNPSNIHNTCCIFVTPW